MNNHISFLAMIRWQDFVDIGINSYILFRIYVLFKGTQTIRALIGIALLLLIGRISMSIGLIVTSWVTQGVTAFAALIIIVAFSGEIRSVFRSKTLQAILWGYNRQETHTPIDLIVESVFEMALKRCGALIVIPGKEDIKDVVQSGLAWQGTISKEMIQTIFFHDNPVHDGAIIIHGNQVTEVGAILPLTARKDLPSFYGTRHRAAIGLAEQKDSLIIVVSEERGSVSVAKGSQLNTITRKIDLDQIIKEHLGVTDNPQTHEKKEKIRLQIAGAVCFVLIFGIWFTTTRAMDTLVTMEVPVEYINLQPGMEILDTSANEVRLLLNGSVMLIKSIRTEQVRMRIDMSKAVIGLNRFTITDGNIIIPPGVLLKKVTPPTVEVTLDVLVEKNIPIQVDLQGKLSEKLIMTDVKVEPETIRLIGGSIMMENLSTVYTEKISLNSIYESGKIIKKIKLNPVYFKIPNGANDSVTITYTVETREVTS